MTTAPPNDILGSIVQRIYDVYFQLNQWDFSSEHRYVSKDLLTYSDLLTCSSRTRDTLEDSSNEATCIKKAESSLITYIQNINGLADKENHPALSGDPVIDNSINRPTDQTKRRKLHYSDAIESSSIGNNNDNNLASETLSNARPNGGGEDAESKKKKMIADLITRIRSALRNKFLLE